MMYLRKGAALMLTVSTLTMLSVRAATADTIPFSYVPEYSNQSVIESVSDQIREVRFDNVLQPFSATDFSLDESSPSSLSSEPTMDALPQSTAPSAPAPPAPHKHYVRNLLIILSIGIGLPILLLVTTDK